jgi:hypothetical protein
MDSKHVNCFVNCGAVQQSTKIFFTFTLDRIRSKIVPMLFLSWFLTYYTESKLMDGTGSVVQLTRESKKARFDPKKLVRPSIHLDFV